MHPEDPTGHVVDMVVDDSIVVDVSVKKQVHPLCRKVAWMRLDCTVQVEFPTCMVSHITA